jgi:hypothetical protein
MGKVVGLQSHGEPGLKLALFGVGKVDAGLFIDKVAQQDEGLIGHFWAGAF